MVVLQSDVDLGSIDDITDVDVYSDKVRNHCETKGLSDLIFSIICFICY